MRVALRATGPRDIDDVWDRYDDLDRWSEWSPQIRAVRCESRRLSGGATGCVLPLIGPGIPFTIDDVDDAAKRWSWTIRLEITSLHLEHTVRWAASGSATTLTVSGSALVVTPYLPLARLALHQLVH